MRKAEKDHEAHSMERRSADPEKRKRGCQVAGPLRGKWEKWATHWQCGEDVQNVEEKPWTNEELRSAEEALPRLKECELETVSRMYKAKTGVGCDGFHSEVTLDLRQKETRVRNR